MGSNTVDLPDRSRGAWMVLFAVSLTNFFTYGFSTSYGVFREYYFRTPPYVGNQEVAYVGPLGLGLIQGVTPFFIHFCSKYPHRIKHLMWVGAVIMVVSSVGAAYSANALQLIMTLGLLYGIGGGCIFAPCLALIDEWFVERRTLANGLFFSVSGLAPATLSPIFATTLQQHSSRATLLGWAVACAVLSCVAIPCARRRRRPSSTAPNSPQVETGSDAVPPPLQPSVATGVLAPSANPPADSLPGQAASSEQAADGKRRGFWKTYAFWLVCTATIAQGLAHFLPPLYVPSYAADLGVSQANASVLITAYQVACMITQPLYGALVDRIGPVYPVLITCLVASASILLCWGLAHVYWPLVLFMVLCGGTSGAFVVFRSSFATCIVAAAGAAGAAADNQTAPSVKRGGNMLAPRPGVAVTEEESGAETVAFEERKLDDDTRATESLVSGILMSIRGVATVCSGLVGKEIVASSQDLPLRSDAYAEGRWRNLVIFTGVSMAVASTGSIAVVKWPKRRV